MDPSRVLGPPGNLAGPAPGPTVLRHPPTSFTSFFDLPLPIPAQFCVYRCLYDIDYHNSAMHKQKLSPRYRNFTKHLAQLKSLVLDAQVIDHTRDIAPGSSTSMNTLMSRAAEQARACLRGDELELAGQSLNNLRPTQQLVITEHASF